MKFTDAFAGEFSEAVRLVHEVRRVCNSCKNLLRTTIGSGGHGEQKFVETGLQFVRINHDALSSIKDSIESGHLAQSFVLVRWHLELSHLFCFLWKNPDDYERWKGGGQIRPSEVGEFFTRQGMATWESVYDICSDVAHGNAKYIEKASGISYMAPIDVDLLSDVDTALKYLMITGHKINMIGISLLKNIAPVSEYNALAKAYETLELDVNAYWTKRDK